jgi:hypothetical protein
LSVRRALGASRFRLARQLHVPDWEVFVRRLLIVLESRLPFPEVPATVRILPAWQWMLTHEDEA